MTNGLKLAQAYELAKAASQACAQLMAVEDPELIPPDIRTKALDVYEELLGCYLTMETRLYDLSEAKEEKKLLADLGQIEVEACIIQSCNLHLNCERANRQAEARGDFIPAPHCYTEDSAVKRAHDAEERAAKAEARAEKAEAEIARLTAPPPLRGPALRDKLINDAISKAGLTLCKVCKGTGQFFDCEDGEYVGCHHCDGKGTAKT